MSSCCKNVLTLWFKTSSPHYVARTCKRTHMHIIQYEGGGEDFPKICEKEVIEQPAASTVHQNTYYTDKNKTYNPM